jgi:hypothetical protein
MSFFESATFSLYCVLSFVLIFYGFAQNHRKKFIIKAIEDNRVKTENSIARREESAVFAVSAANASLAEINKKIDEAKAAEKVAADRVEVLKTQINDLTYRKNELDKYITTNDGRETLERVKIELTELQKKMTEYRSGRIIAAISCSENVYASPYFKSAYDSCVDVWKVHPGLVIKVRQSNTNAIYWLGSNPESLWSFVKSNQQNQVYFTKSFLLSVEVA